MGSVIYDFLNESFLFDPTQIAESYKSVPDSRIVNELSLYREHCLKYLDTLKEEISGASSSLRLFAGAQAPNLRMLKQAALYLDAVVIADPLFPYTATQSDISKALSASLTLSSDDMPDRNGIARAARLLRLCRPMVAVDYVRVFPASLFRESPTQIPVVYSPTAFSDVLAPEVFAKYKAAAKVVSIKQTAAGLEYQNQLYPCRAIAIDFDAPSSSSGYVYTLQEILGLDEESRTVRFGFSQSSVAPPKEEFEHWVNQSVNQAAAKHFSDLSKNVAISSISGSSFLTGSEFEAKILRSENSVASGQSIQSSTLDAVFRLDLQSFEGLSIEDLMTARMDTEAFALFRRELEKQFRDLRTEQDPARLKTKTENAMHELTEVQLTRVGQAIAGLRKRLAIDAVLVGTGFAGTIASSGAGLFAGIAATAMGYKHFTEYRKAIHENPAYFLWKAGLKP